jgi:hypothetical protein
METEQTPDNVNTKHFTQFIHIANISGDKFRELLLCVYTHKEKAEKNIRSLIKFEFVERKSFLRKKTLSSTI